MYVCHLVLWPSRIFVLTRRLTPSQTSLNRFLWFIDHYSYHPKFELFTALNYFAGTVRTQKLSGVPFLFELVAVVSE